jgi:hypothetical protein
MDGMQFRKKMDASSREALVNKLMQGAKMHHSFHVFNIWQRTGHTGTQHTLESMDKCRISWGKITSINGPNIDIKRQPLIIENNQLKLGPSQTLTLKRELEKSSILDDVRAGDVVSIHWDVPCEIINQAQLAYLKKYTAWSMVLANQTI